MTCNKKLITVLISQVFNNGKKWVKHGIPFIDNIGIIKCTFVLKGNTRGT